MELSGIGWLFFQRSARKIFEAVGRSLKGEALYLDPQAVLEINQLVFELRVARLLYEKDTKSGNSFYWSMGLRAFFQQLRTEKAGLLEGSSQQIETIKLRLVSMLHGLFNGTYTEIEAGQQLRHYAVCNFNPCLEQDPGNTIQLSRNNMEELYYALLPWSVSHSFSALPEISLSENDAELMTGVELLLEVVFSEAEADEKLSTTVLRGAERVKSLLEAWSKE